MPHIARALRHRNYRLFFSGQLISLVGTWMQTVAESWLVFRLTESSALLGLSAFVGLIPVFLLAPLGGAAADRFDRRRIIIVTQSVSMTLPLILSALTLSGRVRVWHIFVLAACLGIVNAFDMPARQAFVVDMVGRDDLLNAIALNSSMVNGARIVGPAVAGLTVAAVGEGWCFLINGLSYVAVIAGLLMMRLPRSAPTLTHRSVLQHTIEGFRFIARTAPIRALLILLGIVSFAGLPYSVLMPVFAESILHAGPKGLGVLMGASGTGALAGTLALASRRGVLGLGRWVLTAAVSLGLALMLFSLSRTFWLSVVLLVPVGASMILQMAASNTLIQAMVPDALRGRVMAVYAMMLVGMAPFGSLFAGLVAEKIGAPHTLALGGAICLIAATVFGTRLPVLRAEGRQLIVAQGLSGGDPPAEVTIANPQAG